MNRIVHIAGAARALVRARDGFGQPEGPRRSRSGTELYAVRDESGQFNREEDHAKADRDEEVTPFAERPAPPISGDSAGRLPARAVDVCAAPH